MSIQRKRRVKKKERLEQLAYDAMRVFMKYGFEKSSMRQIADACGMSIGNIYNLVKSKDDLLSVSLNYSFDFAMKIIYRPYDISDLDKSLQEHIFSDYKQLDDTRPFILFSYQQLKNIPEDALKRLLEIDSAFARKYENMLSDGIKQGIFREDIDPVLISQTIVVLGHMWCFRGWSLRDEYTHKQYVEQQLNFIMSSIRKQPHIDEGHCKD